MSNEPKTKREIACFNEGARRAFDKCRLQLEAVTKRRCADGRTWKPIDELATWALKERDGEHWYVAPTKPERLP